MDVLFISFMEAVAIYGLFAALGIAFASPFVNCPTIPDGFPTSPRLICLPTVKLNLALVFAS